MVNAIVYESNTGYTKEYAQMLGRKAGIPVYECKEAYRKLSADDKVIYMGWLMASLIKGYKKAAKRFDIQAVCGVGMQAASDESLQTLIKSNVITGIPAFYLRGGFDINKLRGFYKLLMKLMINTLIKQIETNTPEDVESIDMFKNGGSCVDEANLNPILEWLKQS